MSKFAKNTLITLATRILQLIFGIGSSVIIARVLGPEGKGVYSLAVLLPALLVAFTQFGIGKASVFYVGKRKYSLREVFGTQIILSILIGIFAIIIGITVILFFSDEVFPGVAKEYLILALSLIPFQLFLTLVVHILLGLRKIVKYNFIQLIRTSIYLSLVAIFLLGFRFGIRAAITAQISSFLIACIILFFQTKKETIGVVFSLNKNLFRDFFSYGSKTFFGNVATFLHLRVDMWIIGIFLNPLAVGFYSVAVGLSEKIWLISQSAGTVLFPWVSSEKDSKRLKEFTPLVCRNILFITFLAALTLFVLGRWLIVLFYSRAYLNSVLPFQILVMGTIAVSGGRIMTNDLAGRGKPIINAYVAVASLTLNILLNVMLIPIFGIIGAAWASAISYTFMLILKTIVYCKVSGNKIRDVVLIKKSDFRFYKRFMSVLNKKLMVTVRTG